MPELPEVETVARDLQGWIAGATIVGADVRWDRTIRHPQPPERFVAEIVGATIRRVGRRAKTVLLHLLDGRVMTVALRMTGALIVASPGHADDPYARVIFRLADGRELRYRDVRKFGRIGLWPGGGLRGIGAWRRGSIASRGGRQPTVPHRRSVQRSRSGAARAAVQRRADGGAAARAVREDEDPAARPELHRRRGQHLRRRGAVAGADPSAADGRHAARHRRFGGCIEPFARCFAKESRTAARASATTSEPMASRARTQNGLRSINAPISRAIAAAGPSGASWSDSAAPISALAASRSR